MDGDAAAAVACIFDSYSLVYSIHDTVLEALCKETRNAHAGVAQAARAAKKQGLLGAAACKRLINIDFTYNFIRNLTKVHHDVFLEEFFDELVSRRGTAAQTIHLADALDLSMAPEVAGLAACQAEHEQAEAEEVKLGPMNKVEADKAAKAAAKKVEAEKVSRKKVEAETVAQAAAEKAVVEEAARKKAAAEKEAKTTNPYPNPPLPQPVHTVDYAKNTVDKEKSTVADESTANKEKNTVGKEKDAVAEESITVDEKMSTVVEEKRTDTAAEEASTIAAKRRRTLAEGASAADEEMVDVGLNLLKGPTSTAKSPPVSEVIARLQAAQRVFAH